MNNDLNDSLADLLNDPMGDVRTEPVRGPAGYTPRDFTEPCPKCRGTGSWRGRGQCFACKGVGKQTFKTSPETRSTARQAASARRQANPLENMTAFATEFPDVMAWIVGAGDFAFAVSMKEAVGRFGSLTEGQMAACRKCMDGRRRATEARTAREVSAPAIEIMKIEEAFQAVKDAGLKYPKLNLATFEFKPAAEHGKNRGSIYVTEHDEYLGRVIAGRFICSAACTPEQQEQIIDACADPEAAAIAYGKRTGTCACCRRELTDPESIELGVGPICMKKWGW
jgi:hypothetical protein